MRWVYIWSVLLLSACGSGPIETEKPGDLIPYDKMIDVVVDLNLVEAQVSEVQLLQKVIKDSVHEYYGQLFHKHNISREQLNSSLDYYTTQGSQMDSIYGKAFGKLAFLESKLSNVDISQDELTHIPAEKMVALLEDTNLCKMVINADVSFQTKYDSILSYYRINRSLLDSADVNFRQFGASLKNHAGNMKRLNKLVNAIAEKARER
ncbi:MAG: hypothetical protein ACI9J3_002828 [Parvicellaceae bacterium]|jgi:hypothetical protein